MTPKEIAELVVQYHETKNDPPDPKCGKCKGTGIQTWYCGHNGNEEQSPCDCLERTKNLRGIKVDYISRYCNKEVLEICKGYLDWYNQKIK